MTSKIRKIELNRLRQYLQLRTAGQRVANALSRMTPEVKSLTAWTNSGGGTVSVTRDDLQALLAIVQRAANVTENADDSWTAITRDARKLRGQS